MSVVPQNAKARMEWYEGHVAQFAANAVAVGTTTTATTDLTTKTTTARTKYSAKVAAENAAKVATSEWHGAVLAMATAGASVIDQIRGKAKIVGGTSIYDLAGIPAPATPSPIPAPGVPSGLVATLNPDGSLNLKWKCNTEGAGGTSYQVFRKLGATGAFEFVGVVGKRSMTDATVPSGVASVTYKIVPWRSTVMGTAQYFSVNFGVGGEGEMTASVTPESTTPATPATPPSMTPPSTTPKIAA